MTRTQKTPVWRRHQRRPDRRGMANWAESLQRVVTVTHGSHHPVNTPSIPHGISLRDFLVLFNYWVMFFSSKWKLNKRTLRFLIPLLSHLFSSINRFISFTLALQQHCHYYHQFRFNSSFQLNPSSANSLPWHVPEENHRGKAAQVTLLFLSLSQWCKITSENWLTKSTC